MQTRYLAQQEVVCHDDNTDHHANARCPGMKGVAERYICQNERQAQVAMLLIEVVQEVSELFFEHKAW
jgi:hypothetical protein